MGGCGRGEVPSGRKSHDADPVRVDVPVGGLLPHQFQGRLRVFQWNFGMPVRHPYDGGYPVLVHPFGHVESFVTVSQRDIPASGTDDDSLSGRLRRIGRKNEIIGFRAFVEVRGGQPDVGCGESVAFHGPVGVQRQRLRCLGESARSAQQRADGGQ